MILPILFLCWGSFLNVVAYRLVVAQTFLISRSRCPQCQHRLAWYDLIPVISWILLAGRCRYCKQPISAIYPIIELLTALLLTALYYHTPCIYFPAYFIFISALLVTIHSDMQTMLISRFATIFLVPIGIVASSMHLLPITTIDSIGGTLIGAGFLWLIAKLFFYVRHKEGIGQGDIDLLAFIGSFLGVVGCWLSLCIGALAGALFGGIYTLVYNAHAGTTRIPFGPFLAFGAITVIFFRDTLIYYLLQS
jgi:leader peptidase (prepilin peptidase)/N-methyltransferase